MQNSLSNQQIKHMRKQVEWLKLAVDLLLIPLALVTASLISRYLLQLQIL